MSIGRINIRPPVRAFESIENSDGKQFPKPQVQAGAAARGQKASYSRFPRHRRDGESGNLEKHDLRENGDHWVAANGKYTINMGAALAYWANLDCTSFFLPNHFDSASVKVLNAFRLLTGNGSQMFF